MLLQLTFRQTQYIFNVTLNRCAANSSCLVHQMISNCLDNVKGQKLQCNARVCLECKLRDKIKARVKGYGFHHYRLRTLIRLALLIYKIDKSKELGVPFLHFSSMLEFTPKAAMVILTS